MAGQEALANNRDHLLLTEAENTRRSPSVVSRAFNFSVFLATLLASVAVIIFVAFATPFVVLLSLMADLVDGGDASKGAWTSVKVSESAQ